MQLIFLERDGKVNYLFLNFLFTSRSHETHATLRPVIGGLCFHLWEEIKSDSRQMPSIVSTIIFFIISLGKIPAG